MGHYWSGVEVALTEETYTLSDGTEVTIVETLATQQSAYTHTSETTTFHAYFIRDGVLCNVDTYGWEDDSPQKEVLLKVLDGYSE